MQHQMKYLGARYVGSHDDGSYNDSVCKKGGGGEVTVPASLAAPFGVDTGLRQATIHVQKDYLQLYRIYWLQIKTK